MILLDLGITHVLKCSYRKQFVQKAVAMIYVGLLQNTSCVKGVLSAMYFIAEAWMLITLITIKNCFEKCGLYQLIVYSNDDDDALNLKKMEITRIVCNLIEYTWNTT